MHVYNYCTYIISISYSAILCYITVKLLGYLCWKALFKERCVTFLQQTEVNWSCDPVHVNTNNVLPWQWMIRMRVKKHLMTSAWRYTVLETLRSGVVPGVIADTQLLMLNFSTGLALFQPEQGPLEVLLVVEHQDPDLLQVLRQHIRRISGEVTSKPNLLQTHQTQRVLRQPALLGESQFILSNKLWRHSVPSVVKHRKKRNY